MYSAIEAGVQDLVSYLRVGWWSCFKLVSPAIWDGWLTSIFHTGAVQPPTSDSKQQMLPHTFVVSPWWFPRAQPCWGNSSWCAGVGKHRGRRWNTEGSFKGDRRVTQWLMMLQCFTSGCLMWVIDETSCSLTVNIHELDYCVMSWWILHGCFDESFIVVNEWPACRACPGKRWNVWHGAGKIVPVNHPRFAIGGSFTHLLLL